MLVLADMICQEWSAPASCACGSASAGNIVVVCATYQCISTAVDTVFVLIVSNIGFCTSTEIHKRTRYIFYYPILYT